MKASGWVLQVALYARMPAAAVACHSRMEGSNDGCTSVSGHSTDVSLVALQERFIAPEVSG